MQRLSDAWSALDDWFDPPLPPRAAELARARLRDHTARSSFVRHSVTSTAAGLLVAVVIALAQQVRGASSASIAEMVACGAVIATVFGLLFALTRLMVDGARAALWAAVGALGLSVACPVSFLADACCLEPLARLLGPAAAGYLPAGFALGLVSALLARLATRRRPAAGRYHALWVLGAVTLLAPVAHLETAGAGGSMAWLVLFGALLGSGAVFARDLAALVSPSR